MLEHILVLDAGTTASKVALLTVKGELVCVSNQEYTLLTPTPLQVEISADKFWNALKAGVADVLRRSGIDPRYIRAFSLSAQGETLILLDDCMRPLRNAISWMDSRAQKEAGIIASEFSREEIYKTTGQVSAIPTWPASKLLWVKRNEPSCYRQISKALLVEDYIIWRMTGEFCCEGSLICSSLYWNINTEQWWDEMLGCIGIRKNQLPDIRHSGEKVGKILPSVADELGLSRDIIVSMGALDQACGTIGVGNVKQGIFTENTGAALAICITQESAVPAFDKKGRIPVFCHGLPHSVIVHTFALGGMGLRWYRDQFCQEEMKLGDEIKRDAYDIISDMVQTVPVGSEGLIMLPHLQGAWSPEDNAQAKGVFYGFTLKHGKAHFARAIMEAIGFIIRRNLDIVDEKILRVDEIRVLGGGAKSKTWNQIKSDITGKRVLRTKIDEAACLGAALMAGKGAGLFTSIEDAANQIVTVCELYEPNETNHAAYNETYKKYIDLYDSVLPLFASGQTN
jgi:sugar (pentulose or hexulose) kinase